jgi:hypothetical protein
MSMVFVKTGAQQTSIGKSAHIKGIKEGNAVGNYERMVGHNPDGTSTAARSTGVSAMEPIDPSMPNLSPA